MQPESENKPEKEPDEWKWRGIDISEWVKIVFAFVALLIAINEFVLKQDAVLMARRTASTEFLSKSSDAAVLESFGKVIKLAKEPIPDEINTYDSLIQMTPMHQYLIAFSSCVQSQLCDRSTSKKYLCSMLENYEFLAKEALQKINVRYDFEKRRDEYFGIIEDCGITDPIILPSQLY